MNITNKLKNKIRIIDKALDGHLPKKTMYPPHLAQAMRYSIFSGGKRVRPFLVLEAARLAGGSEQAALPLACAVEMVHTYSLIHDDLPAMDNDDLRRGKPTCHKKFDEATAILAGDALLTHAFYVISKARGVSEHTKMKVIEALSDAVGPYGMVGGQAADIKYGTSKLNTAAIDRINGYKTGRLLTVCLEGGALWGGGTPVQVRSIASYGKSIGFLFQVVDDIIDRDGYVRVAGIKAAYVRASRLRDTAKRELKGFKHRGETLVSFADFLFERKR